MPPRRQWVFDPNSGGVRIPEAVQRRTAERIHRYAQEHFVGRYTKLGIRFRSQFCYIDAYIEPEPLSPIGPRQIGEKPARSISIVCGTHRPTSVGLRYFGNEERWGFAF